MASHHPLTIEQMAELFEEMQRPTHNDVAQTLEALAMDCAERGIELIEVASGFRYQVKSEVHAHVSKLWTERQSRYSRALLETLALIAYRQPITRAEIEAVRGVTVSSHIVRTLEEREWVRVVGHREVPGRPALYGTTRGFLDYFKLKSLEDLPTLSELKDIDNMAPELDFDGSARAIPAIPVADAAAGAVADVDTETGSETGSEDAAEAQASSAAGDNLAGGASDVEQGELSPEAVSEAVSEVESTAQPSSIEAADAGESESSDVEDHSESPTPNSTDELTDEAIEPSSDASLGNEHE